MHDVAIIGVGLHPFGRFPGKSAVQMGADAIRLALGDAGLQWQDIQFAFGGSYEVDNPDTVVSYLGPTGIPFTNVYNGCATAASSLDMAAKMISLGAYDVGVAVGMDKHPNQAFTVDSVEYALPAWYGETGTLPHDEVLRHEDQPVHARPRHQQRDARQGGREELPQRIAQPQRVPPPAPHRGTDPRVTGSQLPVAPVHVLRARRGRGSRHPVPCRPGAPVHVHTHLPAGHGRAHPPARCLRGPRHVRLPPGRRWSDRPGLAGRTFEIAGIGPEDIDVIQLQDTEAGAEVIHMAETGFCADGEQEKLIADGQTEINGRLPINTDGGLMANGEPVGASGLRQVYELTQQLRGQAGERQVPGEPKVGFAQLYGAPGVSGVTIVST